MLVAFSHLRWGFVWQRPQHLLSRFAREMPVLVVEEPEFAGSAPDVRVRRARDVLVATPVLPRALTTCGFGPRVNEAIAALIEPLVAPTSPLLLWYYTPMALGAEPPGREIALAVYDAMDDLASFRGAPAGLREQEARLLRQVDLVFTGGPTLYRQRQRSHPAVHCFPSGVEAHHFAAARNGVRRPAALVSRPRPILGYTGVIDERVDLALLGQIADLRPEWTIALVGPTAKIDAGAIPARPNILRCGQQPYDALPSFLAACNVGLVPFARNDATRAISPTKTLEYLAAGRPVVSTPIGDVVELYGDLVEVASDADAFVAACERVLTRSSAAVLRWQAKVDAALAAREWDAIAAEMLHVMDAAGTRREAPSLPVVRTT